VAAGANRESGRCGLPSEPGRPHPPRLRRRTGDPGPLLRYPARRADARPRPTSSLGAHAGPANARRCLARGPWLGEGARWIRWLHALPSAKRPAISRIRRATLAPCRMTVAMASPIASMVSASTSVPVGRHSTRGASESVPGRQRSRYASSSPRLGQPQRGRFAPCGTDQCSPADERWRQSKNASAERTCCSRPSRLDQPEVSSGGSRWVHNPPGRNVPRCGQ
jgi:hypothetical protein